MSDGGELDRENPRDFIERDIFARMEVGQMHHPSISINKQTYRGEYNDENGVFKAVCKTIKNRPELCKTTNFAYNVTMDEHGYFTK